MLSTDILVRREGGSVIHASRLGPEDGFALNAMQEALYAASGKLSVFAARPVPLAAAHVTAILDSAG